MEGGRNERTNDYLPEIRGMKFLHAADIHLDSPLRGLDRYDGAPAEEIRNATRRALENLVALAIEEEVAFVVLAGDLFDGDWPDFNTGLFFVRQMTRLGDKGISVFAVRGNHDAESKITRKLPWPKNVHFFSSRKAESITLDELDVVLHGQSYADNKIVADLAAGYPGAIAGKINIGVLHTCLDGRPGHASYAPTNIDILKSKGYDYWALGHVHNREVVSAEPLVVFPGNTQGRHIREVGEKGCQVVTLESIGLRAQHRSVDVFRWETIEVGIEGTQDVDAVYERVSARLSEALLRAEARPVAARVRLVGLGKVHDSIAAKPATTREQIRALAIERSNGSIWIEDVILETRADIDLAVLRARADPVGELLRQIDLARAGDEAILSALAQELQSLRQKLPAELVEADGDFRLDDPDHVRRLLDGVESEMISRIADLQGDK